MSSASNTRGKSRIELDVPALTSIGVRGMFYESLAKGIRQCTACGFGDPHTEPVVPVLPNFPVRIMFVGENPPGGEGDAPFAEDTASGRALDEFYLKPLGISRRHAWITNLFKCRYPQRIIGHKKEYARDIQEAAAMCSNCWLLQEIALVKPSIVVTLSDGQVYQRMRSAFGFVTPSRFAVAVGRPHAVTLHGIDTTIFPMIHPDISRPVRYGDNRKLKSRAKWARVHMKEHIPRLRELLRRS